MEMEMEMIHLEIDLSPEDDLEQSITDTISKVCGGALRSLSAQLHYEWRVSTLLGPTPQPVHKQLPDMLYRLTGDGQSLLGRMLAGESVTMSVLDSGVVVQRNNVLCNVLTLLVPLLSVSVLADLFSAWSLTDAQRGFRIAMCEYYVQVSRVVTTFENLGTGAPPLRYAANAMSGSDLLHGEVCFEHINVFQRPETFEELVQARAELRPVGETCVIPDMVQTPPPVVPEDQAHKFLRVLFRMLTANRRKFLWFGQCVRGTEHRADHPLTKRFGLLPPKLDCPSLVDSETLLDVSFADWYLSSQDDDDIAHAFERARECSAGIESKSSRELTATASTFVKVLTRRSCAILNAVAPNCGICDGQYHNLHPSSGGCGTRGLMTCLVPMHSLQLLEMLVCENVDRPNDDVIV